MAAIEDFVVEAVMNDMQQQMVQPNVVSQQSSMQPAGPLGTGNLQSSVPGGGSNADYATRMAQNRFMNVNPETGQPWGAYADQYEAQRVAALQRADQARMTIMQAMRGLDPKIQGTILNRLGIDVGPIKSQIEQEKEMLQYKQQLQQPQQEIENQLKAMGLQRQLGQGQQELGLKERQFQAETAGRGETRNIQLMRVLAMMMQSNPQLQGTLGPMLLQLMQASGINLAPPAAAGGGRRTFSPRPGVTITQE